MQGYQALLARAENVAEVQRMRRSIEARGGFVDISPPTPAGIVRVTLWLPPPLLPGDFFPKLPFYPA